MSLEKKKRKFKTDYRGCTVTIYNENNVETYPVENIWADVVQYEKGTLPLSEAKKFYDIGSGGLSYVYNLDMPAKTEANKIKMLARSVAINNMFKFDRNKPFDIFKLLPYVIAIVALFTR
ncbi:MULTISPECIES: hypothetical protein [Bacillales]|uniref:hypothetical protein n=1 Tax=Bacillales TaxID=1385 RepID=UPI000DE2E1BD|nr:MULTISPECIES: hypothetical protein [Bacillales]MBX0351818.1 hypothetical protein [Bacillus toyonensis]MDA1786661.1 hypothetical protein [Bacillus cereus]MDA1909647.1 hypothetical protein [Bacillus cereus]MDA2191603.1 hypothetical protein [Bacillus cereus]MDA2434945.1 hypothetical protein [Bacillus cereus]